MCVCVLCERAYASRTSTAFLAIRQHTAAMVSIRQHTSTYLDGILGVILVHELGLDDPHTLHDNRMLRQMLRRCRREER